MTNSGYTNKRWLWIFLVLAGCISCSYEEKGKTETALEQAVDHFHDQLNQEKYGEIYSQADAVLRNRATETEFTAQLRQAHEQLGRISGKAIVIIDDTVWRDFLKAFGNKREMISHGNSPASDLIIANERFAWAVEKDQPKLVLYEFRSVCVKPCTVGIGP
jgi:hypothetical protein